jgi:hypothetical protein
VAEFAEDGGQAGSSGCVGCDDAERELYCPFQSCAAVGPDGTRVRRIDMVVLRWLVTGLESDFNR